MDKNLRAFLAELTGTFFVVYLAAGVVCSSFLPEPVRLDVAGIALAQGFALAVALAATLPVSGGFLNPAITLALWVFKRMDGGRAGALIGAQLLGSVLAGLCVWLTYSSAVLGKAQMGTPHLNVLAFGGGPGWSPTPGALLTGIGVELVLTFLVVFAVFTTVLDPRAPRLGGLTVGLAWTAAVLMGYAITGAATNPARWFGPMVWELTLNPRAWTDHVVYWIGPILGALLAGGLYRVVLEPGEREKLPPPAEPVAAAGAAKAKK